MLQEKRTAKEFRGKTTPASGALYFAKGDVRTGGDRGTGFNDDDFLIENKYTDKESYTLTHAVWSKIQLEALNDNLRKGVMQIDVQNTQLVVLDYNDYLELFEGYDLKLHEVTNTSKSYKISCNYKNPYIIHLRRVVSNEFKTLMKVVVIDKDLFLNR